MSDIYKNKENILIVVIVSILISLRFLFMEDITFINDEPWFLGFGLDILETKKFLTLGLEGKMGVKYGPYTAWFYGLLLSISKNLLTIAYLKTGIISFFTLVAGIVGIRSQKNLSYWLLIPLFSSLYLFNYSRLLWDLEISTTFLAVSFYLSFLKDEKKIKIYIALLTCVFATLTHLMSLPTALALGIHFLIFKRQWIKNNLIAFFGLLLLFLSVGGPYYYYVLTTPRIERVAFDPDFRCFFYSFFGARFLTTFDFSYFLGKNWQFIEGTPQVINHIILYLSALTWLPYPVSFFGLYLSIKKLLKNKILNLDPRDGIVFIGVLIILFHWLFSFYGGLRTHPHYYNGSWCGMLLMFWVGFKNLFSNSKFKKAFFVYLGALTMYLLLFIFQVHTHSGNRLPGYGPTLGNQLRVAKKLNSFEYEPLVIKDAWHPKAYPHVLKFIRKMDRLDNQNKKLSSKRVNFKLQYTQPSSRHGGLELVEQ